MYVDCGFERLSKDVLTRTAGYFGAQRSVVLRVLADAALDEIVRQSRLALGKRAQRTVAEVPLLTPAEMACELTEMALCQGALLAAGKIQPALAPQLVPVLQLLRRARRVVVRQRNDLLAARKRPAN